MKILINVKLYAMKDFVNGNIDNSCLRSLVVDLTKCEDVFSSSEFGFAMSVLQALTPISKMLRTFCSSAQYLAVLETLSYTIRESLECVQNWFHSTVYEDFQVVVETKLIDKED